MQKVTGLNTLYHLGYVMVQFRIALNNPSGRYVDAATASAMVWAQLQAMLRDEPVPFTSTRKVVEEFVVALDNYKDALPSNATKLLAGTIDVHRFTDLMTRLESLLAQELDALPIWFVTKRRAYSIDALINSAEQIFDNDAIALLSPRTIKDVREAGRAIAFELPTAAGFHAVRATEAVARGYHELVAGIKPDEEAPLGKVTNGLRTYRDANKTITKEDLLHVVIETLNRLNNVYRKPIAHPDMILDLPGAMNVFDSAKCSIELMLEDAQKKRAPNALPASFF